MPATIAPPQIPHRADDLHGRYVVRVVRHESEQERAVLAEIFRREFPDEFLIFLAVSGQPSAVAKVFPDESHPVSHQHRSENPRQQAGDADACQHDHPVPEEQIDLLVVHVDRQDALDRVLLRVAEVLPADLEVAVCDPRKGHVALFRLRPVLVGDEVPDHVDPEGVVSGGQHDVQEEQLTDHVGDVQDLGDEEQNQEITPLSEMIHSKSYFEPMYTEVCYSCSSYITWVHISLLIFSGSLLICYILYYFRRK